MNMLLTIDVGNTNIKLAIYEGERQLFFERFDTIQDDYTARFLMFFQKYQVDIEKIEDAILSCVVPSIKEVVMETVLTLLKKECIVVDSHYDSGITIDTDQPDEVGSDLIVMCAYAHHRYHQNTLIISFGTATAMCYVDKQGCFKYAIIAPGLNMSAEALWKNAAQLPEFTLRKQESILTNKTIDAMNVGIIDGHIGLCEHLIQRFKEELKEEVYVVASGGMGKLIYPYTDTIKEYSPDFVTDGLAYLYRRREK